MPIRTRITGSPRREDIHRKKLKATHPLLDPRKKQRHHAVWQTIVQEGNPRGGMTAAQIANSCQFYHPQILKDLVDHHLVAKRGRNAEGEVRYIGDDKGRGTYVQELEVEVELFEDDKGYFFTRTTIKGRAGKPGRIVRMLDRRNIKFVIPLPQDEGVEKVVGVVNVDNEEGYNTSPGRGATKVVVGEASKVEDPLLLEGNSLIVKKEIKDL